MIHKELSYRLIGCCMEVHKALGPGLLEQCYHNALYHEIRSSGCTIINYLHIAHLHLGLLVNFQGQRLEWQRLVI